MKKILLKLLDFLQTSDEALEKKDILKKCEESKENVLKFLDGESLKKMDSENSNY